MRVIFTVNEKETQRDTHFEQSQRRIGGESEDTDANRLYFVPKKGETGLRAHLPRGPVREGPLLAGENTHEYTARNFLLVRLSCESSPRECAHVNAGR